MSADIELNWEWPADRVIEDRILIKITDIRKASSGLFGIKKSPSLANSLPDPQVISGVVVNSGSSIDTKSVKLVAPQLEIQEVKAGSYVMLGIVSSTICICIAPVDNKETDLSSISCP